MHLSLGRFVKNLDNFGHSISVSYKGQDSHQTIIGGFMTIIVRVLTAITIVIGFEKVIGMTEPIITSFPRFIPHDEREERGTFSFADLEFNIGVWEQARSVDNEYFYFVPENIARITAWLGT